jgi:hypothetical protein
MTDPSLLILASLADGDKHGYAMMEDIQRFADFALAQERCMVPLLAWNNATVSCRLTRAIIASLTGSRR